VTPKALSIPGQGIDWGFEMEKGAKKAERGGGQTLQGYAQGCVGKQRHANVPWEGEPSRKGRGKARRICVESWGGGRGWEVWQKRMAEGMGPGGSQEMTAGGMRQHQIP
jgi:hypothetical protein